MDAASYAHLADHVWLNPEPEQRWDHTPSVRVTWELIENRMFPLAWRVGAGDQGAALRGELYAVLLTVENALFKKNSLVRAR